MHLMTTRRMRVRKIALHGRSPVCIYEQFNCKICDVRDQNYLHRWPDGTWPSVHRDCILNSDSNYTSDICSAQYAIQGKQKAKVYTQHTHTGQMKKHKKLPINLHIFLIICLKYVCKLGNKPFRNSIFSANSNHIFTAKIVP